MIKIVSNKRKSFIKRNEIYFWTATINNWNRLLWDDSFKNVIIDSWQYLSDQQLIDVFAFVIMPNHLHSIWRANKPNGNESSQASFLKFTAHEFRKKLENESKDSLNIYKVQAHNKAHEFWQRDPLGVPLFTFDVALQKLNYIHQNPLAKHWNLAQKPSDYKYSSARFYETGKSEFPFLKNLWKHF